MRWERATWSASWRRRWVPAQPVSGLQATGTLASAAPIPADLPLLRPQCAAHLLLIIGQVLHFDLLLPPHRITRTQYKPKRAPARSSQYRPLTQAELLAEAARTEIENTKSLEVNECTGWRGTKCGTNSDEAGTAALPAARLYLLCGCSARTGVGVPLLLPTQELWV